MNKYEKDIREKGDLLFMNIKLVVPTAIRGTFRLMLYETLPGQFGLKVLAEYMWWPNIFCEIFHHDKSCNQCLKAGKNLKVLLGTDLTTKLPTQSFANKEINLDFAER